MLNSTRRFRWSGMILWSMFVFSASLLGQESSPVQDRLRDSSEKPVRQLPRSEDRSYERDQMLRHQITSRDITDESVLRAMRNVPRHWFVPDDVIDHAYEDRPLPIGHRQTISQPYVVAFMTEALRIEAQSKVLEVGTGSGYQAAVLSEITPHVFTIEIVEPLGKRAMETFESRGYTDIQTRIGDGYRGWPEEAPFDAIIVTCAPGRVPPQLIEQLKPGGRLCIPVTERNQVQWLQLIEKDESGELKVERTMPVRFVPMTGEAQKRPE